MSYTKFVHGFKSVDGLSLSIDIMQVIYFEEIQGNKIMDPLIRIVFANKDEVLVKDSYQEIANTFNL